LDYIYSRNEDQLIKNIEQEIECPAISTPLSGYKYDTTLAQKPPCEEEITPVSDMLMESGKPAMFRFQMFLWTLIGIAIYLLLFFSDAITMIADAEEFKNCKSNCGSDPLKGFSLPTKAIKRYL
jgi:hypothetical protein